MSDEVAVTDRPQISKLTLSSAGKRIVILFIVLGILLQVGASVANVITSDKATQTSRDLDDYHGQALTAFTLFGAETRSCGGQLPCLHDANTKLGDALARFRQQVDGLSYPANALEDARQVSVDTQNIVDLCRELQVADPPTYNRTAPQLQLLTNRWDRDYQALIDELG